MTRPSTLRTVCRGEQGFTLIELMLAVAVIAVLLGAITLGASAVNSGRLSTTEQDIMTLYKAGAAWASQQANPTFSGVTMALLKSSGVIPNSISGNNPWGNAYTPSGTLTTFTVVTDVSTAANCNALVARLNVRAASASCGATATSTITVNF